MRKRSLRRRMGATLGSQRRKDVVRFRASPPALQTQALVGIRSLAIAPEVTTPRLAQERWISTMQTTTRPSARQRFCSTPPGSKTLLMEDLLFTTTAQAVATSRSDIRLDPL